MFESLLKSIDPKAALAQLAGVDFGPIVREQFDRLAAHFADAESCDIAKISILYAGQNLHYAVAGRYQGQLSDKQVLAILKPTGMLAFIKNQLVQVVRAQLQFLAEHFAEKYEVEVASIQLVTVHGPDAGLWISNGQNYLERLSDAQVNELLAGNFKDLDKAIE